MLRLNDRRLALMLIPLLILLLNSRSIAEGPAPEAETKELQEILDRAVDSTLSKFASVGLKKDELAVTIIDLRDQDSHPAAAYRGESPIHPASVVKMFYMSFYFRMVEDGKIRPTPEVERGLRDMIVDSGNEATGYILDVLTGTTSGPELPPRKFAKWANRRNAVNRYFASLGYRNINVNQKTHCEDAYGVEQQFRNYKGENRNMLTTNAAARLMKEIALGQSVSRARSREMLGLLKREWEDPAKDPADREFISHALVSGTRLWSKEGYTSSTRHDAAYIETADGLKLVITVFTENHSMVHDIIPQLARDVIRGLGGRVR